MASLEEKFSHSPFNSRNRSSSTHKSSICGENDENYSSNFQNQKKIVEKHYMSSTVSTASKVSVEKKILAERNVNSRSPCGEMCKTISLEQNRSFRNSSGSTHSDHRGDSLLNNHSTRPRYMRFNPNRRREILTKIEKQAREESNGSVDYLTLHGEDSLSAKDTNDSSDHLVKESVGTKENEGIKEEEDGSVKYDSDEEEGEFKEERGWCLGGVLKLLITLVACFVSATYIYSVNSSTTAPYQQALWDLNDGCHLIRNQTLEIIDKKMNDAGFLWDRNSHFELLDKVDIEVIDNGESKGQVMVESVEEYEVLVGSNEEIKDIDVGLVVEPENMVVFEDVEIGESKDCQEKEVEASENDGLGGEIEDIDGGLVVELENMVVFEDIEIGESRDCEEKVVEEAENDGLGGETEPETDAFQTVVFCAENGVASDETEMEDSDKFEELELLVKESDHLRSLDGTESIEASTDSVREVELEPEIEDTQVESEKGRHISLFLVAGLAFLSLMLLGLYLRSPKSRITSAERNTPTLHVEDKLSTKPLTMERRVEFLAPTSKISLIEEVRKSRYDNARRTPAERGMPTLHAEDKITAKPLTMERKVEFVAPTSRTSLIEEVRKSRYDINVPSVELLAEIAVGGPRISSQPLPKLTHPMSVKLPIPSSESHPQESVNTNRETSKKEGGRTRKSRTDEATPVRRSSRLLSRAAIVSP